MALRSGLSQPGQSDAPRTYRQPNSSSIQPGRGGSSGIGPEARTAMEEALSKVERLVLREIEASNDRVVLHEALPDRFRHHDLHRGGGHACLPPQPVCDHP